MINGNLNPSAVAEVIQYFTFGLLDDDCVEEAFPSHRGHDVFGQFVQLSSQQLSHPLSVFCKFLLLQHLHVKTRIKQ